MIKVILISVILLAISFSGLAFNLIFRKKGKFPSYRVGHNKDMKKLGIKCVRHEELSCYNKTDKDSCETCDAS